MATFEEKAKAIQTGIPIIAPSVRTPIMGDPQPATTNRTGWRALLGGMDRPTYGVKPGLAEARAMSQEGRAGVPAATSAPVPETMDMVMSKAGTGKMFREGADGKLELIEKPTTPATPVYRIKGEAPVEAEVVPSYSAPTPSTGIDPNQGTSVFDLGFDPRKGGDGWASLMALAGTSKIAKDQYNRKFNTRKLMEGAEKQQFDQWREAEKLGVDKMNARTALRGAEAAVAKAGKVEEEEFKLEAPRVEMVPDAMGIPQPVERAGSIKVGKTEFPVSTKDEYDYITKGGDAMLAAENASRSKPLSPKETTAFYKDAYEALRNSYRRGQATTTTPVK